MLTVFGILGQLLLPNASHIPDAHAPVRSGGCQHRLVKRRPHSLEALLTVAMELVERPLELPHVPKAYNLVGATCDNKVLGKRVERHAVHLAVVCLHIGRWFAIGGTCVPQHKFFVIANLQGMWVSVVETASGDD